MVVKFDSNLTMAVPESTLEDITEILKTQYFGDNCEVEDKIDCSAPPIRNITKISFCQDGKANQCFSLPILDYVVKEEKQDKSFKLLVEENEDKHGKHTIVIYPKFAELYTIFGLKGVVQGISPITQSSEHAEVKPKPAEDKKDK
jgi:hypothetical protein